MSDYGLRNVVRHLGNLKSHKSLSTLFEYKLFIFRNLQFKNYPARIPVTG